MSDAEPHGIPGAQVADLLSESGFDFFTGVPCSLIASLIAALEKRGYIAETREDAALGLAAGAALAGRRPVVLMQNSGLGVSLNALGSLQQIYALPCLLIVTWRGKDGNDAPEHLVMGRAMPAILDAMGIAWRATSAATFASDIGWASAQVAEVAGPVALVVPAGTVA
jgi:phosphonopyruvate decarboxylase